MAAERGVDEWDVVIYEARKALRLLAGGNPNVLSMLWLPENLYIKRTEAGEHLLANRDAFVGRHVYKPFAGYASQQLYKMEHGAFKGYMGDKRKALVERHGYDAKNAAHLIRLLRMGIEFLRDGEMTVLRYDAPELLAIKHGEWSLEKIKTEAERLFRRAEDAYDCSTLPARPDLPSVSSSHPSAGLLGGHPNGRRPLCSLWRIHTSPYALGLGASWRLGLPGLPLPGRERAGRDDWARGQSRSRRMGKRMAVVRPRARTSTLICETCQWVEPKSSLVIEMWSNETGLDFCDICKRRENGLPQPQLREARPSVPHGHPRADAPDAAQDGLSRLLGPEHPRSRRTRVVGADTRR
jgi:hypothetical protein